MKSRIVVALMTTTIAFTPAAATAVASPAAPVATQRSKKKGKKCKKKPGGQTGARYQR